jgi:cyclopropane fatty-acyl-phospholipid synthase-like methyltransferase
MAFDPVHHGQLLVRRAGQVLRRSSEQTRRVETYDEEQRTAEYERGRRAFEQLAERIERFTGAELGSRRALDFGCGVGRLALPLAQRCTHLHGLDVSPEVLAEADRNAKRLGLTNVEWSDASRLPDLRGTYDLAISMYVFQHIPSREGERVFATILAGLTPGGVGAIHFTLRPGRRAGHDGAGAKARPGSRGLRAINWGLPYMLVHSYSLNRIARLLADAGISEWHVKWHETVGRRTYDTAVVFFRKED